jgi:hypothetical protein
MPPKSSGGSSVRDGFDIQSGNVNIGDIQSGNVNIGDIQSGNVNVGRINSKQNSPISINNSYLDQMPEVYSESLVSFTEMLNKEIQKENIAIESAKIVEENLNNLARETVALDEGQVTDVEKKSIRERLMSVATSLVRMSPKIAGPVVIFTPLAPFSELAGNAIDK